MIPAVLYHRLPALQHVTLVEGALVEYLMDLQAVVIAGIFCGVILSIMLCIVFYGLRRPAATDPFTGAMELRYSFPYRVLGFCGLILPCGGIAYFLFEPVKDVGTSVAAGVVAVLFTILSGYLIIETCKARVLISEHGVEALSPWRKPRSIQWSDVARVHSICNSRLFVFQGADGTTITVSLYLSGLRELAVEIRRRLSPSTYSDANRGMRIAEGKQAIWDERHD